MPPKRQCSAKVQGWLVAGGPAKDGFGMSRTFRMFSCDRAE